MSQIQRFKSPIQTAEHLGDPTRAAKILDFGLAKMSPDKVSLMSAHGKHRSVQNEGVLPGIADPA
jgi:hypothetical protein